MGLFGEIGKVLAGGLAFAGHALEHGVARVYHSATGVPTASEKRDQASAVRDQINAYKEQTSIASKQVEEARQSKDVEKRRIEEKQIRSLRRNYRPPGGLLGSQGGIPSPKSLSSVSETPEVSSKLGQ